jgi:seryl-tRNA synthetase
MLDINYILENKDKVKEAITSKSVRGITANDVDTLEVIYTEIRNIQQQVQVLRTERNTIAEQIPAEQNPTAKTALIAKGKEVKEKVQDLEEQLRVKEKEYNRLMSFIPGVPSEDTPRGIDENDNVVVKEWGKKPEFGFPVKDHVELLTNNGMLDLKRGSKVSGFRGYFLNGDLATLHWAVLMYSFQKLVAKGYTPVVPPILIKPFTLFGSGHYPWSDVDVYEVSKPGVDETGEEVKEPIYLAATAEIPLMGMYTDETIDLSKGPIKMVGISPCYRREIGSYSKDVKGLYRVHEFNKIEQVILCEPNDELAEKLHQEIIQNSEEILQEMELPYRILAMCTGDMGEPQYKKFDIETWMPGKNNYGETHSASNMRDFQCRRNNIKTVVDGKKVVAYSLNNTALANPRFLIALVENYQTQDGKIRVPKVLQPFVGKEIIG